MSNYQDGDPTKPPYDQYDPYTSRSRRPSELWDEPRASRPRREKPEGSQRPRGLAGRHPIIMNLLYIVVAAVAVGWALMWFLDFWTFHGEERAVPDVKGQPYSAAQATVEGNALRAVIADSVFDVYSRPGTVVEQVPIPGAKIKKGGNVYLTVVAFSPKLVTIPDFYNVSIRQARSMFEGLGIVGLREEQVPSEYEGLVLGAKFNGVELRPGAKIPMSAVVTLQVGAVPEEYAEGDSTSLDQEIEDVIEQLNIE